MKKLIIIVGIFCYINGNSQIIDSSWYTVKYRLVYSPDVNDLERKGDDIMLLSMRPYQSIYYSYLAQLGNRNLEKQSSAANSDNASHVVSVGSKDAGGVAKLFFDKEWEVLNSKFDSRKVNVSEKFSFSDDMVFSYDDSLIIPIWNIKSDTLTLLGQLCQKATTDFKGRVYSAWFAPSIPFSMGPWMLNGLPGLILKAEDEKKEYSFTCMELGTDSSYTKVFEPYPNHRDISKKKMREIKYVYRTDYMSFINGVSGKSVTLTKTDGAPARGKIKPYNPIDLSKED